MNKAHLDQVLSSLQQNKQTWVDATPINNKLEILQELKESLSAVKLEWISTSMAYKEIVPNSIGEEEEWLSLANLFNLLDTFRQSLIEIQDTGRPTIPGEIRVRPDGQVIVPVFPRTRFDQLLCTSIRGEVWMEHEVKPNEVTQTQARAYREGNQIGKICLVLGAGNYGVLQYCDVIYKLFVENQVVILKLNPAADFIGPATEKALDPLIRRGFLGIVYGGSTEGAYLCQHELVDELHLTGSDKTFETIVFGPGKDGQKRKINRKPINKRRFTAELGNISPIIVVPGPWSNKDVKRQGIRIGSWLTINAGFNCLTPRLIVQRKSWKHRDTLLEAVGHALTATETRKAYYPGAFELHEEFTSAHPEAKRYGHPGSTELPWTVVAGIDATDSSDICFQKEAFCSLMAETTLQADSVADYIEKAVSFVNENVWGTLCATILIHPESLTEPAIAEAFTDAIANLRYGAIAVNMWHTYIYFFRSSPWGGYAGQDIYDIQSGLGFINNGLMLERPQKSVFYAPFKPRSDPLITTAKRFDFGQKMVTFEENHSIPNLLSLFWSALRS